MDYKYHLAKYAGKSSRLPCPVCGRNFCFSPYVDDEGNVLDETVGRCDHESSCGYHLTPGQYFQQHPEARPRGEDWRQAPDWMKRREYKQRRLVIPRPQPTQQTNICTLPSEIVAKTLRNAPKSTLLQFLETIFDATTVERLRADFCLGVTKDRSVIYYQIDQDGRYRAGKIMQYDPVSGHRIKDTGIPVDWVHARLMKQGILRENWTVSQCLFGENQLLKNPDAIVCLVESEKTALIGSGFCPQYLWLATGGKTQLGTKLNVLQGRKILVFPDIDAHDAWVEAFAKMPYLNATFSDILQQECTQEDRVAKIDIADWLLRWRSNCRVPSVPPVPSCTGTEQYSNPVAREVAKYFPADVMPEVAALIEDLDLELVSVSQIKSE